MRLRRAGLGIVSLSLSSLAYAHRLDEYLQLAALSLGPKSVHATLYLTPGVAVSKRVVGLMDRNGDGKLSVAERRAYAQSVAHDLVLAVDGKPRPFRVVAFQFPSVESMRKGMGEVRLELEAVASDSSGRHILAFENRHERPIAAYLVECLVPEARSLQVVAQSRSREQEKYRLEYVRTLSSPSSRTSFRPFGHAGTAPG